MARFSSGPSTPPFIKISNPARRARKITIPNPLSFYSFSITFSRLLALLLFLLTPFLLNSCIEGEEEVWINPDASGHARIKISAPTLLFSKFGGIEQIIADAREGLADSDNITLTQLEATKEGSRTTLNGKVTFKDARQVGSFLAQFRDPPGSPEKSDEELIFGDTDLQVALPEYSFSRKVDIRPLIPPGSVNPMTTRLLEDAKLTYQIHLPTAVTTHNADHISEDRKSLQWQVPLTTMLTGPVEMQFSAPVPHLARYIVLLVLISIFLLFLVAIFLKRRTKNKPNPS